MKPENVKAIEFVKSNLSQIKSSNTMYILNGSAGDISKAHIESNFELFKSLTILIPDLTIEPVIVINNKNQEVVSGIGVFEASAVRKKTEYIIHNGPQEFISFM